MASPTKTVAKRVDRPLAGNEFMSGLSPFFAGCAVLTDQPVAKQVNTAERRSLLHRGSLPSLGRSHTLLARGKAFSLKGYSPGPVPPTEREQSLPKERYDDPATKIRSAPDSNHACSGGA